MSQAKINKRFKPAKYKGPIRQIECPKILNMENCRDQTISFINEIRKSFLTEENSGIRLNFDLVEEISPEAALLLLAEIERCFRYNYQKKIYGSRPPAHQVKELLSEIGFFEYFSTPTPQYEKTKKRTYTKVKSGNKTQGELVSKLIDNFESIGPFSPSLKRFLYGALVECMDNVNQHAYQKELSKGLPTLQGMWWMMGYCDENFSEISFIFYDQGSGIPATLKNKWEKAIGGFFKEDNEYITEAIREGSSRLKNVRRGNGLPKLARLMDMSPLGQLFVHSNKAYNLFQAVEGKAEDVSHDASEHLQGTLVSLKIIRQPDDTLSLLNNE